MAYSPVGCIVMSIAILDPTSEVFHPPHIGGQPATKYSLTSSRRVYSIPLWQVIVIKECVLFVSCAVHIRPLSNLCGWVKMLLRKRAGCKLKPQSWILLLSRGVFAVEVKEVGITCCLWLWQNEPGTCGMKKTKSYSILVSKEYIHMVHCLTCSMYWALVSQRFVSL